MRWIIKSILHRRTHIKSVLYWHTYTYLQCAVHLYNIYMILFVYACRYISSYVCLYICPHGFELQVHRPSIKGTKLLLKVIKAIIITTCMFVCKSYVLPSRWPPSRKIFMVSGTSWNIFILKTHGVNTHAAYTYAETSMHTSTFSRLGPASTNGTCPERR